MASGVEWPVAIGAVSPDTHAPALQALTEPLVVGAIAVTLSGVMVGLLLARRGMSREPRAALSEDVSIVGSERLRPGAQATLEAFTVEGARSCAASLIAVDRRHLRLAVPATALPIRCGTPVVVTSPDQSALLRYRTSVVGHSAKDGTVVLHLRRPAWLERVQRRRFFRVPLDVPSFLAPVPARCERPGTFRCLITELSACGFRIATATAFRAGDIVRVRVPVHGMGEPALDARVLRCGCGDRRGYPFSLACELLQLPDETREGIVRYCFDAERATRRRGRESAGK
ncbi:MAG TPA: PilZ domain-containing protein [Chthonomonadales bacterium]|nr:PilZ domain-containing protein [Chthonomonadales bacterium]